MGSVGLEQRISGLLAEVNRDADYPLSLVCTDQGLLVASAGDHLSSTELAGLTSLFDDIVMRARRDLGSSWVDEVTLLEPDRGRMVVRPLPVQVGARFFLVLQVPPRARWRRNSNRLIRVLTGWLDAALEGTA